MSVSVLHREIYSEREAARILRMPPSTLHYWLEGGERRGKTYAPVIRIEPTGSKAVTWAEFVEAAMLRRYRREQNIPMAELREVIDRLRRETGAPYPLAHEAPFIGAGRQLVSRIQDEVGLDPDFCLISIVRQQLMLTPASKEFYDRVVWQEGTAVAWRPDADPESTRTHRSRTTRRAPERRRHQHRGALGARRGRRGRREHRRGVRPDPARRPLRPRLREPPSRRGVTA